MTLLPTSFPVYFVWFLWLCLGLCVGSFANVIIWRLPRRLLHVHTEGLSKPASHCQTCNRSLAIWEIIPLLSFVLLRGHCRTCRQPIAWRHFLVEILSASVFGYCAWRFDFAWPTLIWACVWMAFVTLALIDWDFFLLPDVLTLPLLLLGLIFAFGGWNFATTWHNSWLGAGSAYAILWTVGWGFKLLRGQEVLGAGDAKLLAALGAWVGFTALWAILFWASFGGLLFVFIQKRLTVLCSRPLLLRPATNHLRVQEWFDSVPEQALPFGFFLVLSTALMWFGFLPTLQPIVSLFA